MSLKRDVRNRGISYFLGFILIIFQKMATFPVLYTIYIVAYLYNIKLFRGKRTCNICLITANIITRPS